MNADKGIHHRTVEDTPQYIASPPLKKRRNFAAIKSSASILLVINSSGIYGSQLVDQYETHGNIMKSPKFASPCRLRAFLTCEMREPLASTIVHVHGAYSAKGY
jgi:hypothetical protein